MTVRAWLALAWLALAPAAAAVRENGARDVELDGRRVHYEVHGTGPALMVMPNAWGLTHRALRAMYAPLEKRATLVYFDPRGMGGSGPARDDADRGMAAVRADFEALRRHLGLGRVAAIGWSNGAMNLLLHAAEKPDTLSHVVLVHGIASWTPDDTKAFVSTYPEMAARYGEAEKALADPALDDAARTARRRAFWTEEYFPFLLADPGKSRPGLDAMLRGEPFSYPHARATSRETGTYDARPVLDRVTARTLVIAGAKDASPPDRVKEIADGIDGAEFVVFGKSGHFAPLEEPRKFRRTVLRFLDAD